MANTIHNHIVVNCPLCRVNLVYLEESEIHELPNGSLLCVDCWIEDFDSDATEMMDRLSARRAIQ